MPDSTLGFDPTSQWAFKPTQFGGAQADLSKPISKFANIFRRTQSESPLPTKLSARSAWARSLRRKDQKKRWQR